MKKIQKVFVGSEFWVLLILIINLGCYKGSDVTQRELDWLLRTRRIPEGVECRLPGPEVAPILKSGEYVVFVAHFERGFGLPASNIFGTSSTSSFSNHTTFRLTPFLLSLPLLPSRRAISVFGHRSVFGPSTSPSGSRSSPTRTIPLPSRR